MYLATLIFCRMVAGGLWVRSARHCWWRWCDYNSFNQSQSVNYRGRSNTLPPNLTSLCPVMTRSKTRLIWAGSGSESWWKRTRSDEREESLSDRNWTTRAGRPAVVPVKTEEACLFFTAHAVASFCGRLMFSRSDQIRCLERRAEQGHWNLTRTLIYSQKHKQWGETCSV